MEPRTESQHPQPPIPFINGGDDQMADSVNATALTCWLQALMLFLSGVQSHFVGCALCRLKKLPKALLKLVCVHPGTGDANAVIDFESQTAKWLNGLQASLLMPPSHRIGFSHLSGILKVLELGVMPLSRPFIAVLSCSKLKLLDLTVLGTGLYRRPLTGFSLS